MATRKIAQVSATTPIVSQHTLISQLYSIFPNECICCLLISLQYLFMFKFINSYSNDKYSSIKENAMKEANFKFKNSKVHLELDVWIPNLKLAFEFQV